MTRVYFCELCEGIFESPWSDAEAQAEYARTFPGMEQEPQSTLCEDCYKRVIDDPTTKRRTPL